MAKIKSVVIVGGGSSGWMTAAALSKHFPHYKITLVESPNFPIIGVGESTLQHINEYLDLLELKDHQWMTQCDASYKLAIKYTGFLKDNDHSFNFMLSNVRKILEFDEIEFLLLNKIYPDIKMEDIHKFNHPTYNMVEKKKFTNNSNRQFNWEFETEKAYHFDAIKFGQTLKKLIAIPNGVNHIQDEVIDTLLNEYGEIDFLMTQNNGKLHADLYIDCTGFKGLLIEQALKVKFESFSNILINDSAVTANIDYENKNEELQPYTNSTCLENGWMWNIPLWSRVGTGYVYSSHFVNDETALNQFKNGLRKTYGDARADSIQPKFIKFKTGTKETPWYKNVLAIGLSSGFIEPLGSTGLMLTHNNIVRLVNILKITDSNIKSVDKLVFNKDYKQEIYMVRDFIAWQVAFSPRRDTDYWKHVTEHIDYSYATTMPTINELASLIHDDSLLHKPDTIKKVIERYYNPISDYKFQKMKKYIDFNHFDRLKKKYDSIQLKINLQIDGLPSLYEHLQETIYKGY
jgi:tryptophan halogenase